MVKQPARIAVVLFNLGAPDSLDAVRPFLFNLFNDPAIIKLPTPFRLALATLISRIRSKKARTIYEHLGGGSPLLANTRAQADALAHDLQGEDDIRVFVAMRYWHPFIDEAIAQVRAFAPEKIILLPLYPQWSNTTTGSSFAAWDTATKDLSIPTHRICCYPNESGFITAIADLTRDVLVDAGRYGRPRVLFSAHGLPEKIVAAGDPYQWQCEKTAAAIIDVLGIPNLDTVSCYQSRVGPLRWIGPATDAEIRRAGKDRVPVVLVPVSFVSEHSETLVELDIDYRHLAETAGVPFCGRVPTVQTHTAFIGGLATLVRRSIAEARPRPMSADDGLCPKTFGLCCQTRVLP